MPRRHAVLALVVAVCWAVNFVVIDIGLESSPPLLFVALRFGLIALPAIFFVPRPDVRFPGMCDPAVPRRASKSDTQGAFVKAAIVVWGFGSLAFID